MILANVTRNELTINGRELLVTGSLHTNFVQFSFSKEWDNLVRIAIFKTHLHNIAITIPSTNILSIPWESYETIGDTVRLGCYGVDATDQIIFPTIWATLGTIVDGADITTSIRNGNAENMYQILLQAFDDLEKKVDTAGSHPALTQRNVADQHPISAITNLSAELSTKLGTNEYLSNDRLLELVGASNRRRNGR